jgi:predicted CopG family antitoxin
MAVKTITIDMEAYELLSRRKRRGQSFSQVIKERFKMGKTCADLLAALARARISEDALRAMERGMEARRRDYTQRPRP